MRITADLSALGGIHEIPHYLLIHIIDPKTHQPMLPRTVILFPIVIPSAAKDLATPTFVILFTIVIPSVLHGKRKIETSVDR